VAQARAYPAPVADQALEQLVAAVTGQAPSGAEVIGASISPDGRYGAAVTYLPSSSYLMDDVFEFVEGGWQLHSGGSAGVNWTSLEDDAMSGVMRYVDGAPETATAAVLTYEGTEYLVSVHHGHFLLVVWNTRYAEQPRIIRFE
jgi:hypothetical protein